MSERPRVALIHATPNALTPTVTGFADAFPDAEPWHLLDDRLMGDAEAAGGLTPALEARMHRLIGHALAEDAAAVLLTCSLYGPAVATRPGPGSSDAPVLAADEAAFDRVRDGGYRRVLVLASLEPALADTTTRLRAHCAGAAVDVQVRGLVPPGAREATGDTDALTAALLDGVRAATAGADDADAVDAVFLAQFSLAPAAAGLETALGIPVVAGPQAAADRLRTLLTDGGAR